MPLPLRVCVLVCALVCVLALTVSSPAAARVLDGQAIMHQAGNANMCAVTFDDGPSQYTAQLLDTLQAEGVHATFFVLGKQVERHPDLIQRMVREGHEVGSHSYSHPNFRKLSPAEQWWQLSRTVDLLQDLGAKPASFRPPYGKYSEVTTDFAAELGMSIVLWSSDSQDWKRRPADYSQMRTTSGRPALPGQMHGIFLFHDIHRGTVEDASVIIATLRAGGCQRFVTVQEYMASEAQDAPLYTAVPKDNNATADAAQLQPAAAQTVQNTQTAQTAQAVQTVQNSLNPTAPVASAGSKGEIGKGLAETGPEEDELMAQIPVGLPPMDSPRVATAANKQKSPTQQTVPLARSSQPWPWSLFNNSGT